MAKFLIHNTNVQPPRPTKSQEHRPSNVREPRPIAAVLMLSPDLRVTSHLIDPQFALAADRSR